MAGGKTVNYSDQGASGRSDPPPQEDDPDGPDKDRNFVTALARGLDLLRCFTPNERLLGNQELAERTGLPKATVSRLTYTLTQLGCIKKSSLSGKYHLDVGVLAFGYQMLSNLAVRRIAHPFMEEVASHVGAAVALAARDRLQMVYIDSALPMQLSQGHAASSMRRQVGSYLPVHVSSLGRVCLAAMPADERTVVMDQIRKQHADDWPRISAALESAFRDYADHGYCLSLGEWTRELNAIAVPMVHREYGILAFNCGGPSFQLSREMLENDVGPRLKHMVLQIESVDW